MVERSEDLARLQPLVGLWDTEVKVFEGTGRRPIETDGSVEKDWVLGGRFLREDLAGVDQDGEPYMGIGYLGFDDSTATYQSVWMNTAAGGMAICRGRADHTGRVLTLEGDEPDAEGGPPRRFRATIRIESTERHVLTQDYRRPDGAWEPGFEIIYTRFAGVVR